MQKPTSFVVIRSLLLAALLTLTLFVSNAHSQPVITSPPTNQTVAAGGTATFMVVATGTAPLAYHWRQNGVPVPGSAATLTLPNVSDSMAGGYVVVVSDVSGSATSSPPAILTVIHPPVIVTQPANDVLTNGDVAFFAVGVNGANLSYQWQSNNVPLPGETNSDLVIDPVLVADSASYSVVVTNQDGTATSSNALLTIVEQPLTTSQSIAAPIHTCTNITFTVITHGTDLPLTYQWYKDGTPVGTNSSYTVSDVSFSDAGPYSVSVSDLIGASATAVASITVTDPPPVVLTRNITIQLDASGNASITPAQVNNGSYDNCSVASLSVSPNMFTCANVGPNTVTLFVTDNTSQVSSSTATVTVQDVTPPVPVFNTISVQLDNTGNYTLTPADMSNIGVGSSDACGVTSTNVSPNTFGCCDVGNKTVTLTVTDANGNPATANGTITVLAPAGAPAMVYVDANYPVGCQAVAFPYIGGTGTKYIGYNAFSTIQAGLNAVAVGGTVNVSAGLFSENLAVNKWLILAGAGSGNNPASSTIVTSGAANTPVITITAGGASGTDRLVISGLNVNGATGSENPGSGIQLAAPGAHYTLSNVTSTNNSGDGFGQDLGSGGNNDILVADCSFSGNGIAGFRVPTAGSIDGLTVTNSHFDGNVYGIEAFMGNGSGSVFQNVNVSHSTFNNNSSKGAYFEKLGNATFSSVVVSNSGNTGGFAAGFNINLKYGSYGGILISNSDFINSGAGDRVNGGGLVIEARGTGSDSGYSANPASLDGVTLAGLNVTGSPDGIRFGEPGKNNIGPTNVVVYDCNLAGNASNGIHNDSQTLTSAASNWWSSVSGPSGAANPYGTGTGVNGPVTFSPWLADGTDTSADVGFQPNESPVNYPPAQLVFTAEPGGANLGSLLSPQPIVSVEDAFGNVTPWANPVVTLAVGNNPGGGVLTGTNPQLAMSGAATFTDLAITVGGGGGYTLVASAPSLTSAISSSFDIANPAPTIASLNPFFARAGGSAFSLTVNGSGFVPSSQVYWNGTMRPTTFISASKLSAAISANDILNVGTAQVTAVSPAPSGGTSSQLPFEIKPPKPSVVYVDQNYTPLPANSMVNWPYTGTGTNIIGYDAFAAIQGGVNAVASGGTVYVAAGSYAEAVAANKSVALQGANLGVPGCAARGAESAINGGAGIAVDVQSDGVTVDGFALAGGIGLRDASHQALIARNNSITAAAVGVELESIAPTLAAGVTVQSNCVSLTGQLAGSTQTIGVAIFGVAGTTSPVILGNSIDGAFYGYLLYALDAAQPTAVQGGSITGVMQGVAVININPLTFTSYLPSAFAVNGISMSGFTGNYSAVPALAGANFQAGVYVFTGGTNPATAISGLISNVVVTGTGKISPDSSGLYFGDFSTAPGLMQRITVQQSTVQNNLNRGIFVTGSNAVLDVTECSIISNGSDPYVTGGNPGFGIIARNNAQATVTQCFVSNPPVQMHDTVYALSADANTNPQGPTLTVSNCSVVNNGNGGLAHQSAGVLNASGDWWGGTSAAMIAGLMTGTVDFTPYLDSGTDTDPATPGFQGDFSVLHVTTLGSQTGAGGRIQEGINLIADGSLTGGSRTVYVEAGTYSEAAAGVFGITVNQPLTLLGTGGPGLTTINGTDLYMIYVPSPNVTLSGLSVTDPTYNSGGFGGDGSGIWIGGTGVTGILVTNCVVHDLGERPFGINAGPEGTVEVGGSTVFNIHGYPISEEKPYIVGSSSDFGDQAFGIFTWAWGLTASADIHDNVVYGLDPRPFSSGISCGSGSGEITNNQVTLASGCLGGGINVPPWSGPGTVTIQSNTVNGPTYGLLLEGQYGQFALNNTINNAAGASIDVLDSAATVKGNSASAGSAVGVLVSGSAAKALIEGNTLVGDSEAGIRADSGATVDAGDCTGGDVTGLGTGSGPTGSSAGGNILAGYGFDSAAPWAIENLNSSGPAVLAYENSFGAIVDDDIRTLLVQTSPVKFTQSGGLLLKCPNPVTVQCTSELPTGATDLAGFFAQAGSMVSCSDAVVGFSDNPMAGSYPISGPITRTYTLTDACGQTASCQQIITVHDLTPPTIIACAPNTNIDADATAHAPIPDLTGRVMASDFCSLALTVTQVPPAGTTVGLGNTSVVLTVTDAAGLSNSCTAIVTVRDVTAPTITCPPDVTVTILQDKDPYATGTATATDAGESVTVTYDDDRSGLTNCDSTGWILRTWKATDQSGNTNVCVQTITIIDTNAPVFTFIPANIITTNDTGTCSAVVNYSPPTAQDLGYFQGFENPAWVGGDIDTQPSTDWNNGPSRILRVVSGTDGITSKSGSAHAIVDSTGINPRSNFNDGGNTTGVFGRLGGYSGVFGTGYRVALDVYLNLSDAAVLANTYGFDLDTASSDNANNFLRDFIFHAASTASGSILVAADNNSNFAKRDDLATINHYEVTNSGWYTFEWNFRASNGVLAVDCNLTDASGSLLWTETLSDPSDLIPAVGGHRYMWFTFVIPDRLPIDNTVLERNTPVVSVPASGSSFLVGATIVTNTTADACGNATNTTFTVTVNDVEPPSANVPTNIVQNNDPGQCGATVSFILPAQTDNCGVSNTVATPASGSVFPVGTSTVIVVVQDIHGNTANNTFTVTVDDVEPPSANVPANVVVDNDPGLTTAVVNFTLPTQTDNCGMASTNVTPPSGSVFPPGTSTVTVVVTDIHGNSATNAFTVTVIDQPVIVAQPLSRTNNATTTATFTVLATGTPPFTYQWYKNGTNALMDGGKISGSTNSVLAITDVLAADGGDYSVIINNPAGRPAISSNAVLVVIDPYITLQPLSVTNSLGSRVSFTAAAVGTQPLSYRWQFDGVDLVGDANHTGVNTATLMIGSIEDSDAGDYTVVVTNSVGEAVSEESLLEITHPPVIVLQPVSLTVNLGQSATFQVSADGRTPFTYQWQKNGTNLMDGPNIAGSNAKKLVLNSVAASDAGSYLVIVSNGDGTTNSVSATLTVIVPPDITIQPLGLTNNAGTTAAFTVTASGTAPSYQWVKNGTNLLSDGANISGSASNILTITNLLGTNDGIYSVVISNAAGTVTSSNAVLVVIDPIITSEPVSLTVNLGTPASFSVGAYGTAPQYQWQKDGTNLLGATASTYAIVAVADADRGQYTVVVSNGYGAATSAPPAVLTIIDPPVITIKPASRTNNAGTIATFTVTTSGTAPFSYQWSKGAMPLSDTGNISGSATATLTITGVSDADATSYSVVISNAAGTATSTGATLTVIDPPIITRQPLGLTNNATTTSVFTVAASGTAPSYRWFRNGTNQLTDGGKISGSMSNVLTITNVLAADDGQYSVVVSNAAGVVTSSNAVLVVIDPAILVQPMSHTNIDGSTVTFSVAAVGTVPLGYRWQQDGDDVIGATNTTLTISSIADSDAGSYTVIVTNSVGSVTSSPAILVTVPPLIVSQPASTNVVAGQAVSFSVSVNGAVPFSYQWLKNGTNIAGATNRIFAISHTVLADAGNYQVVVSNPDGTQTSEVAVLGVYATATPTLTLASYSNGHATVALTGVPGFSYAIQGSAGLINWISLITNAAPYSLVDTNHLENRYYRAIYLP